MRPAADLGAGDDRGLGEGGRIAGDVPPGGGDDLPRVEAAGILVGAACLGPGDDALWVERGRFERIRRAYGPMNGGRGTDEAVSTRFGPGGRAAGAATGRFLLDLRHGATRIGLRDGPRRGRDAGLRTVPGRGRLGPGPIPAGLPLPAMGPGAAAALGPRRR